MGSVSRLTVYLAEEGDVEGRTFHGLVEMRIRTGRGESSAGEARALEQLMELSDAYEMRHRARQSEVEK